MSDSSTPSPWARPSPGSDPSVSYEVRWPPTVPGEPGTPPGGESAGPQTPPARKSRLDPRLWWFAGGAGAVLVVGLVAVLVLVLSGQGGWSGAKPAAPADVRPPLARLCPPGTETLPADPAPTAEAGSDAQPTGARIVDSTAGISYRAYGAPWQPWTTVWSAGTLEVPYSVGQHFITEPLYNGISNYHASILSAAVPAADNDAFTLNLECVGRQVAADVRAEYYPQPNRMELLREERTTLGGRPAWVTVFRLHFSRPDLQARDELAAVACIDVGRPTAAVLYVSIPGTHRQYDWIVDDVLASVRPV